MAKQSLVIVESPAKAKTIGKYLGKDYEVKACKTAPSLALHHHTCLTC